MTTVITNKGIITMTNELTIIDVSGVTAVELFAKSENVEDLISKMEKEAKSFVWDISTEKGRKAIASFAYQIARSKTALDGLGKNLVADRKAEIAKVDAERKKIRDRLEVLQEEVRKPLTDWENKEKDRIIMHEQRILLISNLSVFDFSPETWQIEERLAALSFNYENFDFEEFSKRAIDAIEQTKKTLSEMLKSSKKRDADRLELEALRKAEDERKQRERDEEIKRAAAEKARKEADEEAAAKAKAEKDKADKEKRDIEEKAEQDRKDKEDAERRANEAFAAAKKAEADRIAAEKKAEADRVEAQEKADRDRKEAVERAKKEEHDRIAAEEKQKADEIAKREADKNHRAKINRAALTVIQSIVDECISQKTDIAKAIIVSIAKGDVPNIKINY